MLGRWINLWAKGFHFIICIFFLLSNVQGVPIRNFEELEKACRKVLKRHNDKKKQHLFWVLLYDWQGGIIRQDGKLYLTRDNDTCLSRQEIKQRLAQHPMKNKDVRRIVQGIQAVALNDAQRQLLLNLFYIPLCEKYPKAVNSTREVGIDIYTDRAERIKFLKEVEDELGVKLNKDQRQALWDLFSIRLHRDASVDDDVWDDDPPGY